MICYLVNGCEKNEYFEKKTHQKNDKSKKFNLRRQRNVIYHNTVLSNKKKSYNINFTSNST